TFTYTPKNLGHRYRRPEEFRVRFNQFRNLLNERLMAPQPFDDHIGIQQDLIHSSISDAECLREASGHIALCRQGPFDPSKLLLTGVPIRAYRSFLFLRIFLGCIREQVPIPFGLFAGSLSKGFSQYRRPDRVVSVSSRCILYIAMPDSPAICRPPLKQRVYTAPNDCLPVYRKTCGAGYIQRVEEPFAAGEVGRSKSGSGGRTLRLMSSLLRLGPHFQARFVSLQRRDSKLHLKL